MQTRTNDTKPNFKLAFTLLAVVQATLIFTIVMIGIPLPTIGVAFGINEADLLLVSTAYGLSFSGLLLFGGRLTDKFGGRVLLIIGLCVFGLASVGAALSFHFSGMVMMRFLQGAGAAMTAPAAIAVLRSLFPQPDDFSRAMATWGGVSVLGGGVGFLASGVVTTWVSWRWMFIVPVLVSLIGLAAVAWLLPKGDKPMMSNQPGLDPLGALLATLGIALCSYGLIASGDFAWSSPRVYGPLCVGISLLSIFLLVERHAKAPLLPPGFVREPNRIVGLIGILLASASMGLVTFLLSLFLQVQQNWTPLETAGAFIPYTLTLLLMNRAAGGIVSRLGPLKVTILGLLIGSIGLALLSGIHLQVTYISGLLPGIVALTIGTSMMFAGSAVLSTMNVPQQQAGLAGGVMNTAMELGPTFGLASLMAVAGFAPSVVSGYSLAFGTAAGVYLFAAGLAWFLTCHKPHQMETVGAGNTES
ncbi:MFS transporter [Photobacterium sp. TY1-4]|uniref:MFS transporter n=1 Tax=Photobacterium sp. TY1-4 TaxID=2899122 RepID=UPI0021C0BBD8|nr:MFS transporter [Photobacterium sp. TY1-4]UXI00394.1 MFS transporter [Photobacterium sp. TY1-4]